MSEPLWDRYRDLNIHLRLIDLADPEAIDRQLHEVWKCLVFKEFQDLPRAEKLIRELETLLAEARDRV